MSQVTLTCLLSATTKLLLLGYLPKIKSGRARSLVKSSRQHSSPRRAQGISVRAYPARSCGRTIFVTAAHRDDGNGEKLTAFLQIESGDAYRVKPCIKIRRRLSRQ